MTRSLQPITQCQRGDTAIEAAIALPILLMLMTGVSEIGSAMRVQNTLQYAVDGAARCAAINTIDCGSIAQVQALAATYSDTIKAPANSFVVSDATCGKQVSVSYAFTGGIPGFGRFAPVLSASSCYPT